MSTIAGNVKRNKIFFVYPGLVKNVYISFVWPCHVRDTCSLQRQQRLRSDDAQRNSRNDESETSCDLVYMKTNYPREYVTAREFQVPAARKYTFLTGLASHRDVRFDTPVPRNGSTSLIKVVVSPSHAK